MYDGYNVIYFNKDNPSHNLDVVDIQIFEKLSDGHFLIISSDNKIHRFNPITKEIINTLTPDSLARYNLANTISRESTGSLFTENMILPDEHGGYYAMFISSDKTTYYLFHSATGEEIQLVHSFDSSGPQSMAYANGKIFITQSKGVAIYNKDFDPIDSFTLYNDSEEGFPILSTNKEGTVLLYTDCKKQTCPIYEYDSLSNAFTLIKLPASLDQRGIYKIQSIGDVLWLFGVNRLIRFDRQNNSYEYLFTQIKEAFSSLSTTPLISHYTSVTKQGSDQHWLTSSYGLVKLAPPSKTIDIFISNNKDLCNGYCSMRGLGADKYGNLWMASYSGLIKKEPNGNLSKAAILKNVSQGIYSLNIQEDDLLVNDVLYNLKSKKTTVLIPEKKNGHVTNTFGSNNDVWLATCYANGQEVSLYNYNLKTKSRKEIKIEGNLKQAGQITDLILSKDTNNLWLSTANKGSYGYDIANNKFYSITPQKYWKNNSNRHYCIYENENGSIYVGTTGALLKINSQDNSVTSHILPNIRKDGSTYKRSYFSILPQNDSILWLGTDNGLIKMNLNSDEFNALAHLGPIGREEFNRESTFKDENGRMYFGSVNGVYTFHPDKLDLSSASFQKEIIVVSIQHFDSSTHELDTKKNLRSKKLDFDHDDRMIKINLAFPSYKKYEKPFFSYRLEGFDEEWSKPIADNQIAFTSLLPGKYVLKVKGGHDQLQLDSKVTSISITVHDAWYNLWWVRAIIYLLAVGLLYYIFSTRYKQIKKYEQLRTDISQDLHDDVGTMLTGIAMQAELLENFVNDSSKLTARKISNNSREAMSRMRDTVWAIDANKDTSKDLVERILDYVNDCLVIQDIKTLVESNIKNDSQKIQPNIRQNVYLIAKESINNMAKHSDTEKADIQLLLDKKELILRIKDFGTETVLKTSGQGLKNMARRAESISGSYTFGYDTDGYLTELIVKL